MSCSAPLLLARCCLTRRPVCCSSGTALRRGITLSLSTSPHDVSDVFSGVSGVACRCVSGSSGTSTSSGSGGFSLGELAQAFQQLGSATPSSASDDGGGATAASASTATTVITARPASTSATAAGRPQHASAQQQQRRTHALSRRAHDTRPSTSPAAGSTASQGRDQRNYNSSKSSFAHQQTASASRMTSGAERPNVFFSAAYASHLASLGLPQLSNEVETQLSRREVGCMLQCLYEVILQRLPNALASNAAATVKPVCDAAILAAAVDAPSQRQHPSAMPASSRPSTLQPPLRVLDLTVLTETHTQQPRSAKAEGTRFAWREQGNVVRNHRLLTAILRMVTLVDVYGLEADMDAWLNCTSRHTSTTQERVESAPPPPFSYRVSRGILGWLAQEVSRMDAHTSLQVLHLLAQQSLLWSEAVLNTLVDTLLVHLTTVAAAASISPAAKEAGALPPPPLLPFTLDQHSLLLDTISRYQAQMTQVTRLQSALPAPGVRALHGSAVPSALSDEDASSTADEEATCTRAFIDGAGQRRAVLTRSNHPVANSALFFVTADALTRVLRAPRSVSSTTSSLHHVGTATVLFLTRAVSKLHWWSASLMAALTSPLTRYLQAHPESFVGVVMLVGRPENRVGDAELLFVLQESLLLHLRRRRHTQDGGAMTKKEHDDGKKKYDGATAQVRDAVDRSPSTLSARAGEARENNGGEGEGSGEEEDDEEDGGWMLLSGRTQATASSASADTPLPAPSAASCSLMKPTLMASVPSTDRTPHNAKEASRWMDRAANSLSLIDWHAFPGFLESLVRFHLRTVHAMSSSHVVVATPPSSMRNSSIATTTSATTSAAVTSPVLHARMRELFRLLQADMQCTIASLDSLAVTVSSALLARTLLTLITATDDLRQAEELDKDAPEATHVSPLMVELAYVWTLQVSHQRPPPLPPRDGRASRAASDIAQFHRVAATTRWRRALRVHHRLVRAGLLERTQSCAASSSTRSTASAEKEIDVPERTISMPGRYFMPDAVVCVAPRVHAALQEAKARLHDARQRQVAQLLRCTAPDGESGELFTASEHQASQHRPPPHQQHQHSSQQQQRESQHNRSAPRFASDGIRGDGTVQRRIDHVEAERRRAAVAALRRPVRTSDLFSRYSMAVSRLL